ncbi:hypothetical protein GCM10007380_20020 [Gottfriedia solisilvae]|uniref:Uncharacterized protein n=1 Tax=Gottfriedia solisilvae TaxID=1516104 RepID=A0A8J3AHF7_9BACI|nr:hypothetical protein GCM10007380_20020 [Gottfriedia solisilvae]
MFDFIYPVLPILNMLFFMALIIYIILKVGKKNNNKLMRILGKFLIIYVSFIIIIGVVTYFKNP